VREGVFEEKLSQREKTELMIIANPRKYCAEPGSSSNRKIFGAAVMSTIGVSLLHTCCKSQQPE
jgi:hypothetical protein